MLDGVWERACSQRNLTQLDSNMCGLQGNISNGIRIAKLSPSNLIYKTPHMIYVHETFICASLNFFLLIAPHGYSCCSNTGRTSARPSCHCHHVFVYAHASVTSGQWHHFPPFLSCHCACALVQTHFDGSVHHDGWILQNPSKS